MADTKANLSISWRAVAIAAAVIALAALSATAIVATIKNADTLSVVALAVAVIAFVIQILVFIVQAAAATEQGLRAQEIYGSTLKALAAIEEKAEGTRQAVNTISDRMLAAIIAKAVPGAVESGAPVNSVDFSIEVAERVADLVRELSASDGPNLGTSIRHDVLSGRVSEAVGIAYPSGIDIGQIVGELLSLDVNALRYVSALAGDFAEFSSRPEMIGLPISEDDMREQLLRAELIRRTADSSLWTLSEKGRISAGILTSPAIPRDAPSGVVELRRKLVRR
jgi:hypothetical protein